MKKFHVAREITMTEVIEVEAVNVDDAISRVYFYEGRLLTTEETNPIVVKAWEKPTGISDPNE